MTAETTFRLELHKFYENLFPDETGLRDSCGWKCHFAKNYFQSLPKSDIRKFVRGTLIRMKVDSSYLTDNSLNFITERIYNEFKYTILDERISFILKSKTEINKNDSTRKGFFAKIFGLFRKDR